MPQMPACMVRWATWRQPAQLSEPQLIRQMCQLQQWQQTSLQSAICPQLVACSRLSVQALQQPPQQHQLQQLALLQQRWEAQTQPASSTQPPGMVAPCAGTYMLLAQAL